MQSLRGATPIDAMDEAPENVRQNTAGLFGRAYRQQPPLIPHRIDGYEIDLKVNKCLSCHDWPGNVEQGAPKVSETHYVSREGIALDHVARTRYFCTQCHVPQANAPALVANTFKNAKEVQ
ncbi:MAG: nitrate reductase cytochrome c-type subunit [Geminicoccaceae bacterium]